VITTLVTLLLVPAAATAPPAVPVSCQSFARGNAQAPQPVREWLAHSGDERVLVCAQPGRSAADVATAVYTAEGAVTRRGEVCSYPSHGLTLEGSGAAQRLRRYESGEATAMALVARDCPPPHPPTAANPYTTTFDVSHEAFLSIMQLWSAVAVSVPAFEREFSCCSAGGAQPGGAPRALGSTDVRDRLRAAIVAGDMKAAAVTRIVRIPSSTFRRRYALFVTDPAKGAAGAGFYVIYLRRDVRGPSHIMGVAETE
jgi:hypothetical protein